ncbi:ectoine synthase [bacterium]|nr:ectoine synthase [bacterium]
MIVRSVKELIGTRRDILTETWVSRRLLLREDGMGFSLHETLVRAGTETEMCYKNHLEAVYCVEGEGEVEVLPKGGVYPVAPGTMYALDGHERHVLRARTTLRLVCVFNPPCAGREVHGPDGAYPLTEEDER